MPLLDRKEHPPGAKVPPKLSVNDEVFVVRCTGEVVRSYEEYNFKRNLYAQHQWQDKYYGRTGLTYEEALRFEEQAENQIKEQFPNNLEESVVRQIHHSTMRKDDLINQIHSSLKPIGAQPTDSDKENGTPASSTPRTPPVTKRLLTHFLIYVADKLKPGIWVCKEQWVLKYDLPPEPPVGLQPSSGRNMAAAALAGDSTPMKSPRKSADAAAGAAPVRTLEEEEARLKPGTVKEAAFRVMKARGTQPTTVEDVIRVSTIDGTRTDWQDKTKRTLNTVLSTDGAFTRVGRGQYVLTAFSKDIPLLSPGAESGLSGGASAAQASKAAAAPSTNDKAQQSGKEAAEGGDQAGLVRAEQMLTQAQKAVAARQGDLDAVNKQLDVCQKRLNEAKAQHKSTNKSSPAKQTAADADGLPTAAELDRMFALPEDLREYTGSEDDRKAKSAWRTEKAKKEKELAAERTKYLQELRLKAAREAQSSMSGLQQAYDRAKKSAEEASARLGKALKAEAEAQKAVEREKQREMLKEIKEKAKEDKEKQKQAEKEDREKRRQEALAAKRYPIDDLELLTEDLTAAMTAAAEAAGTSSAAAAHAATLAPEQLDLTCLANAKHLAPEESLELGQVLYVADTVSQFSKQLGVKRCTHVELRSMLAAAAVGTCDAAGADAFSKQEVREAMQWLAATYTQLLTVLIEDITQLDNASRLFHRWSEALESGAGAWPELARRWVLLQQQDHLASQEALEVAKYLRTHEVSDLKPQQHLALLTQLLDDCMDSHRIRDALANRIERGAELAAEIRAELVEGRKKLKELQEAEKESRRRKRAAALALATAAAERQLRERGELPTGAEGAAAADTAAPDAVDDAAAVKDGKTSEAAGSNATGAASGGAKDTMAKKIQQTSKEILARVAGTGVSHVTLAELEAELAGDFEEELTWELPPDLQSYSGPVGDKKMMSEFRRKQQEARKKLDKERAKWQAGKAERGKVKAEAKKREIEAERRLHAERMRAEQELAEQQENLELKLEKYLVRRQPLGSDRFNRMYWWGLAGNKDGLMLQQETGCTEIMLQLLHEAAGEAITAQAAADEQKARAHGSKAAMDVDQQQHQSGCASPSEVKQDIGSPMDQSPKAEVLIWPIDHKGLLLPAGTEAWALIEDAELLETLANNLEQRGVREKDLKQTLDKMLPAMSAAIGKAAAARAAAEEAAAAAADSATKKGRPKKEKEPVVHRELPSRHARSAAAEQIKKTGSAAAAAAKAKDEAATVAAAAAAAAMAGDDESGAFHGWRLAAVKSAISNLQKLSAAAAAAKVEPPSTASSWAQYRKLLDALIEGDISVSWQEETAAAAAAALPAADSPAAASSTAKDGNYVEAAHAAAVALAAAGSAAEDDKQQVEAAAAVAQLRLQLLGFEQHLVAATGELTYLYRGAAAAADDEDVESEGEVETSEQRQQSNSKAVKADSSKQQASEQQDDATEVEQQSAAAITKGKGNRGKAASSDSRRAKRAASAVSSGDEALAAGAGEEVRSQVANADGRASKRVKAAGAADKGLPPRPAGRGHAAAEDAAKGEVSPHSGEASVAAVHTAVAVAAGNKRGRAAKRSAAAAAAGSRATSQEPEQLDEEQKQCNKKQKQAAQKRRGRKAGAAEDEDAAHDDAHNVTSISEDAEEAGHETADRRRLSLPNQKQHLSEQTDEPDEVVAEEGDEVIPIRLRGKAIWMHGEERDSWRAAVVAAATVSGLSYCAAALLFHAQQPLEALAAAKTTAGKKKASKK